MIDLGREAPVARGDDRMLALQRRRRRCDALPAASCAAVGLAGYSAASAVEAHAAASDRYLY